MVAVAQRRSRCLLLKRRILLFRFTHHCIPQKSKRAKCHFGRYTIYFRRLALLPGLADAKQRIVGKDQGNALGKAALG